MFFQIIRLESERTQWEQRYLEETAMRQVAIDAASIPKDAKIAALEKTSAESEKLIADARNDKMRQFEEMQTSQVIKRFIWEIFFYRKTKFCDESQINFFIHLYNSDFFKEMKSFKRLTFLLLMYNELKYGKSPFWQDNALAAKTKINVFRKFFRVECPQRRSK